ncbi:MAG: flippase-like domain-containing protein [Acidobacteria bacterium]|nr:flippase-like domain-containing protein [Acidobacteriota bacterium]MCG2809927.1 lysylphosphatidylglycerol synthase domain-containing protein [Candidatus Aminicenantes bacterium]
MSSQQPTTIKKASDRKASKLVKNFIAPAVVLIIIVYVFFRDISPGDIMANFLKIPFAYLIAFILLSLLGTILRAWKYRILLSGKLTYKEIFLITLVRNFSVDLLPGRTAALIFYSWLTKKKGIALEEGASSFIISVFYDAIALVLMLGGLLFFLETEISRWPFYVVMAILFFLSALVIFFSDRFFEFLLKGKKLKRLHLAKIEGTIRKINDYLLEHGKNSERLKIFAISFAARIIKYMHNFILFEGVLHLGTGLKNFSLFCFGLAATEMSSLIPIQGPAGFGTWELAFSFVFSTLQLPAPNIKEAGFVIHITSQAWEYSIGLLALAYLAFRRAGRKPRSIQP